MTETTDSNPDIPVLLDPVEARVLGCLMEKKAVTPENYPMTLNAVVTACNQKTSRNPVMKLEPGKVGHALRTLEQRDYVESEFGARASRYAHIAEAALNLTGEQRALICLLLLRGPQTVAELYTRSERMAGFESPEDVHYALERLAAHDPPRVVCLGRAAGQREDRWMHLLCGSVDHLVLSQAAQAPEPGEPAESSSDLVARLEALEHRIAELEARLDGSGRAEED